jgi:hypothetical protein
MKALLLAALGLAAAFAVPAQAQYAAYPYAAPAYAYPAPAYAYPRPVSPAQVYPPSWSYDPYTSGQAPCPQGARGETLHCDFRIQPTYGQPSYWPVH